MHKRNQLELRKLGVTMENRIGLPDAALDKNFWDRFFLRRRGKSPVVLQFSCCQFAPIARAAQELCLQSAHNLQMEE
jgi:hypothetical protein